MTKHQAAGELIILIGQLRHQIKTTYRESVRQELTNQIKAIEIAVTALTSHKGR